MKNSDWKKRFPLLMLAMILLLAQAPQAVMAASLPNGWWPVWDAYQKAEASGSTDNLLERGDDVIKFYSDKKMNTDIANQLYMVYYTRMNRNIFEDRGDYAAAKSNLSSLLSISEYLTANGNDRNDMIKICKTRLELIDPQWGVYAVSYNQNNTYGSSVAAGSGTYYGAIFGSQNFSQKSITSFYVEMERETAQTYSGYISQRDDGTRVILINLNFEKEGDTARAVPNGTYDANIRTTFRYLNTLKSPAIVRIGGEMDVWTKTVKPADFIKAYRHVANIARQEAPKVELIWSPNSTSAWDVNTADFYPGDAYVDWVGLSLYYNYASEYGDSQTWVEYTRGQRFADPLRKADKVYKIAEAHNKPVIATEGGATRNTTNDGSGETWTARVTAKEYSTLNMVYPRVKAIVHFDRAINGNDYSLSGAVYTAASNAMQANPALIQPGQTSAGTWVPIQKINEPARNTLLIGAAGMTYKKSDMSAVYKLDNGSAVSTSGSPNHFTVDLSKMQKGSNHRLDVTLSDGNGYKVSKTYTIALLYNGKVRCFEGWRPTQFSDVKDNMYYLDPIKWAVKNEITNGTSETTFAPDAACTRGQVVTFLWRAQGCPEPEMLKEKEPADSGNDPADSGDAQGNEPEAPDNNTGNEPADSGDIETPEIGTDPEDTPIDEPDDGSRQTVPTSNPFSDVKESDYFYKAVLWAVEQGITIGTSETTFSPDADCTRGHVVTFLWRSAREPRAFSASHKFTDLKTGDYYYNAVLWAVEKEITKGTTETTFSPAQVCTRGQVVTFLYRAQK